MKRIRTLLVVSSALLWTALAQPANFNCNDRQRQLGSGCSNCAPYTRAQSLNGRPNAYCGQDACDRATQIVLEEGTCRTCPAGQRPDSAGRDCVGGGAPGPVNQPTCDCTEFRLNGQCVACTAGLVAREDGQGCVTP